LRGRIVLPQPADGAIVAVLDQAFDKIELVLPWIEMHEIRFPKVLLEKTGYPACFFGFHAASIPAFGQFKYKKKR
jgi:hypothetical protein